MRSSRGVGLRIWTALELRYRCYCPRGMDPPARAPRSAGLACAGQDGNRACDCEPSCFGSRDAVDGPGSLLLYSYTRRSRPLPIAGCGVLPVAGFYNPYTQLPMPLCHPWTLVVLTHIGRPPRSCRVTGLSVPRIELPEDPCRKSLDELGVSRVARMGVGLCTNTREEAMSSDLSVPFGPPSSCWRSSATHGGPPPSGGHRHRSYRRAQPERGKAPFARADPVRSLGLCGRLPCRARVRSRAPCPSAGDLGTLAGAVPNSYTRRPRDLMRRYFSPWRASHHLLSKLRHGFSISRRWPRLRCLPGRYELFVESDVRRVVDYLEPDTGASWCPTSSPACFRSCTP